MKEHNYSSWALDTLLVHSNQFNYTSNNSGIPSVEPISTSTTYLHRNAEMLDQAFSGISPSGEPAYVYARQGNPNAQTLEKVLMLRVVVVLVMMCVAMFLMQHCSHQGLLLDQKY